MDEPAKLLIVDDEKANRELLKRQLTRQSYICKEASDGASALEALHQEPFDLVLLDLVMPGMDGIDVLSTIGREQIDVETIVVTGYGRIHTAVSAMKAGAFDYIEKPVDVHMLFGSIERALRHRHIVRQARNMTNAARQWEATFDAVPDLVALIDNEQRFVRVNRAMAERLGKKPHELVGKNCYEFAHEAGEPPANCPHHRTTQDHTEHLATVYEKRFGGHFIVSTSPLLDSEGKLTGTVHVARDISTLKQVEEESRRAHKEAERLLASMSSFLIGVDRQGIITRWNVAAELTFGLQSQEAVGKPFEYCGIQWDWDLVQELLPIWVGKHHASRQPEVRYTRPDGREGVLSITVNPIQDDGERADGFFLLGSDVTDRKILEAQLSQAQKLESIGQLAAGIAHEINTPTQYVGDNIDFLQFAFSMLLDCQAMCLELLEAAESGSVNRELLTRIHKHMEEADLDYLREQIPQAIQQSLEGVKRIASIVLAMKEFSHPGIKEKTRVDLNHCIESTITVSRNEWKYVADLETDFAADLPPVDCLPGEFNQVVLNILINAAHAIAGVVGDGSNGKGKITVSTRCADYWVEVRISDTGPGVPDTIQNRIFDPFFTTKEVGKGTGQGLAIARNVIVDRHGGTLSFETEQGKGTTFIIRLPVGSV